MPETSDDVPAADREVFLRENAVAVVADKDRKIGRLRVELDRMRKKAEGRKKLITELRAAIARSTAELARRAEDAKP